MWGFWAPTTPVKPDNIYEAFLATVLASTSKNGGDATQRTAKGTQQTFRIPRHAHGRISHVGRRPRGR